MTWIDISQPLKNTMPVWPGDSPYSYKLNWTKDKNTVVNVGSISMSTHCGTHVDAPFHFDNNGKKIHEMDLSLYVGKVQVIHVFNQECIKPEHLDKFNIQNCKRLIIRTNSWENKDKFPNNITHIDPSLAPFLSNKGINLLGVDTPSVDSLNSKELLAHHSLLENKIHILEGLVLSLIEEGSYEMIALPLNIVNGDGSPVRAVLRQKS